MQVDVRGVWIVVNPIVKKALRDCVNVLGVGAV
jgi:hypothetical protein